MLLFVQFFSSDHKEFRIWVSHLLPNSSFLNGNYGTFVEIITKIPRVIESVTMRTSLRNNIVNKEKYWNVEDVIGRIAPMSGTG